MGLKNISIIVVNYNGKKLLEKYLPSLVDACKHYSFEDTELILVDDASIDGTIDYLRINFPFIKLIKQETSRGFSDSANLGVSAASNKIAVLLNNDIELSEDFFQFLPVHFEDSEVFAVRPGVKYNPAETIDDLRSPKIGASFNAGFIDVPREAKKKNNFAFFAGGAGAAFNKEKFMELKGFDKIFRPFYYEDVDLCYRAWKRGWKIIYEPRSLLYHKGGATISRFYSPGFIDRIAERNRYFLVWRNITDWKLIFQHLIFIPVRIFINLIKGRFFRIAGLFCGLRYLKVVINTRRVEKKFYKLRDKEIFAIFN